MDYKVPLLEEALTAYEKENELFDRKKFDDVQILSVVFKAMDLVKNLAIPVVSNCTICNDEINYKGVCEMCYTELKLNNLD